MLGGDAGERGEGLVEGAIGAVVAADGAIGDAERAVGVGVGVVALRLEQRGHKGGAQAGICTGLPLAVVAELPQQRVEVDDERQRGILARLNLGPLGLEQPHLGVERQERRLCVELVDRLRDGLRRGAVGLEEAVDRLDAGVGRQRCGPVEEPGKEPLVGLQHELRVAPLHPVG